MRLAPNRTGFALAVGGAFSALAYLVLFLIFQGVFL